MSTFGGLLRRAPRAREPDRVDQANLPPDGWHTPPGSAGAGVTVHVSGTGIRFPHREFGGRARCGGAVPDVGATASDGGGHGTRGTATVVGGRSGA
ncbi:peptidase S8 and S53 subtilisin kexin sedolisin, partial [Streptomyces zinciresistens K42]